ncbi:MAG TPA: M48 family metalloprotease [Ohtaekwangia sp.]|nr:M48 family metalloprotease [Ohtaekwangia sp.]
MIRFFGVLVLCFPAFCLFAQFEKNYKPAPVLDTIPPALLGELKTKLEKDKAGITGSSSQVNAFLKSLYEKRYEYLIRNYNDDLFIDDDVITPYLQGILEEIYKANPGIPRETQVYAMRSTAPNAVSFGDGTLGFTLGLLARMENDAQVAFVLCHEMAHFHKEHSRQDLTSLAKLNFDKALKKKIDAARKSEYDRYTKMKEVFKGLGFSITHHTRGHEYEADAQGFVYFANTRFKPAAAIRVMEILDSTSILRFRYPIDFKKHFDVKGYPFKDSWLDYTKSTTWHAPPDEDDSAKTHPDCQKRIVALNIQMQSLGTDTSGDAHIDPRGIRYISTASEFEMVASEVHFRQYGKALFRALILAEQFPDNIYLQAMITRCLYQLYRYQRNHELGKILELPDPRFPDNYDRFLTFMHKLRLSELASIVYYYATTRPVTCYEDEEFLYALWMCSTLELSKLAPDKVKEAYAAKFPDGKYLGNMK